MGKKRIVLFTISFIAITLVLLRSLVIAESDWPAFFVVISQIEPQTTPPPPPIRALVETPDIDRLPPVVGTLLPRLPVPELDTPTPAVTVWPTNTPWPSPTSPPNNQPWPTNTPWPTNPSPNNPPPDNQPWTSPTPWPSPTLQPTPFPPAPTRAPVEGGQITFVDVQNRVLTHDARRLGVNLGGHNQFGAALLLKNIIPNPGFEAAEMAMIFNAAPAVSTNRFQADSWQTSWNNEAAGVGQAVGFWNGARFEVLTGVAKGRSGIISEYTHEGGMPTFRTTGGGTSPQPADAIMVRQDKFGYFDPTKSPFADPDMTTTRPDSPGTQSLRLTQSADFQPSHRIIFDSLGRDADTTAGKLVQIRGNWYVSIWAKGENPGDQLRLRFERVQGDTFLNHHISLTDQWQKYHIPFYVPDYADPAVGGITKPLIFALYVPEGKGDVWVDDVVLSSADHTNPTVFSDNMVNKLKELQPGVLRDWGLQLGSSLDNQLAVGFGRKTTGHHPLDSNPADYHYSLQDFLRLSQHVGAEPWYVIPPTLTHKELKDLMAFLSAPVGTHPYADLRAELGQYSPWTNVFRQIHLELGNEMWGGNDGGDQFIGATVRGGDNLAQFTRDRYGMMRWSGYHVEGKINYILGGQTNLPNRQRDMLRQTNAHDTVAFAPYYGYDFTQFGSDMDRYYPLYAEAIQSVQSGFMAQNQDFINFFDPDANVAIYEINLHTTNSGMPLHVRNEIVTSHAAGLALPLHMLTYQRDLQIRHQAAFTTMQFSHQLPDNSGFVRLWGLLRDTEAGGIERPAWQALSLANIGINDKTQMLETMQSGKNPTHIQGAVNGVTADTELPLVQSFAFQNQWGTEYGVVLFNLHLTESQVVTVRFPKQVNVYGTMYSLTAPSPRTTNETGENTNMTIQGYQINVETGLTLPPHSMIVLTTD